MGLTIGAPPGISHARGGTVNQTLRTPLKNSLTQLVERELRDALISGRLRPGEALKIRDLATQLGVSPTPVREALMKLAAERAIEANHARSFRVPVLTRDGYVEICAIRRAVEGLAAAQAAGKATPPEIRTLRGINRQFQDAKARGDAAATLIHNQRFRFGLYALSGMPSLLAIIESLWLRIGPAFTLLYPRSPSDPEYRQEYADALRALERRDPDAARAAIERAIDIGSLRIMAHFDRPASQCGKRDALDRPVHAPAAKRARKSG
jgi:GntR family colanic acid and biofilm gene transcriptional regulator